MLGHRAGRRGVLPWQKSRLASCWHPWCCGAGLPARQKGHLGVISPFPADLPQIRSVPGARATSCPVRKALRALLVR